MIIVPATLAHLPELVAKALAYSGETWQGARRSPCKNQVYATFKALILSNDAINYVVLLNDEVIGVLCGYIGRTWWQEPCGVISMLCVDKQHRGTKAARMLLINSLGAFKKQGCGFVTVSCDSGISEQNNKAFANLFIKFGFRDMGNGSLIIDLLGNHYG